MLVIESAPVPVLVRVTVCPGLVVPTNCVANVKLVGFSDTAGLPELTPVPDTASDSGLSGALSVMLRLAERAPVAAGVNDTLMVHVFPAATATLQVLVWLKSPGLVPVKVIAVIFRFLLPVLVTVTF